jgi:hypothetical protein
MSTKTIEEVTAPANVASARTGGKALAANVSDALVAGGRAYVNGVRELGRTLGGFGREIGVEAGRHVQATFESRNLREAAELQAAWAQHRIETSTAHAKEFTDLAWAKTEDVIAPFAALLKQDKAA